MFNNLFNNNRYYKANVNKNKAIFDSELNELDRLADTLFAIGTVLSFLSTDIAEQSIVLEQAQQLSSQEESAFTYDIAKLLGLANWIFLTAGILFLDTSYERLKEEEASTSQNASLSSKERLLGREMVTIGNFIKTIGFTVTATGFEIIVDSIEKETDSTS